MANNNLFKYISGVGTKIIHRSIIVAIIKILNNVPNPGFCLRNIHKNKTETLTMKVTKPTDILVLIDIPWAKTLHGDAPVNETISRPSPVPNKVNPNTKKKIVINFGLKLKGFFELHDFLGIFFIVKNINY